MVPLFPNPFIEFVRIMHLASAGVDAIVTRIICLTRLTAFDEPSWAVAALFLWPILLTLAACSTRAYSHFCIFAFFPPPHLFALVCVLLFQECVCSQCLQTRDVAGLVKTLCFLLDTFTAYGKLRCVRCVCCVRVSASPTARQRFACCFAIRTRFYNFHSVLV
jgi:hypothetical protein